MIELITESGEEKSFFVLPDVGAQIAEIEKMELSPQEKLLKKDQLMQDFSIKSERIHTVVQLLKAYTLFDKDTEYVVMEDAVKIVDEQTGRILDGRRYSDGLHQAIEAKENVKIEASTQTYATVTLQNYFRMYHKLCGMTGTAETEAAELWDIYKLDVVTIPTNLKAIRKDEQDLVYKTKREKYKAVIDDIENGRDGLNGCLLRLALFRALLGALLAVQDIGARNVVLASAHQGEFDLVLDIFDVERAARGAPAHQRMDRGVSQ